LGFDLLVFGWYSTSFARFGFYDMCIVGFWCVLGFVVF